MLVKDSTSLWKRILGTPSDWLWRPRLRTPRLGLRHVAPAVVFGTSVAAWPAFAGATGDEGSVAFGLYIGAVSIMLMAWSFLLRRKV